MRLDSVPVGTSTKKKANTPNFYENGIVSDKVKDRGNDPYFVKKAEEAKEFLRKHPIPEELLKK